MKLNMATKPLSTAHVPSYSLFAQLLANERLTLRVDTSLQTAAFVPSQRLLLLPSWSGFSNEAWLLFIAHEVGHALFTPEDSLTTNATWVRLTAAHGVEVVKSVTNVFEDIRIERLVRARYRGLSGIFGRGYNALLLSSFFGFKPSDLTDAVWAEKNVLDRINLYAKVGGLLRRTLSTPQEIGWYNRGLFCETYEDVLALVEEVILALNDEQKKKLVNQQSSQPSNQNGRSSKADQPSNESSQPSQAGEPTQPSQDGEPTKPSQAGEPTQPSQAGEPTKSSQDGEPSQDSQPSQAPAVEEATTANGQECGSDPFAVASQQSAAQALASARRGHLTDVGQVDTILPTDTKYLHHNDVTIEQMLAGWRAPAEVRAVFRQAILSARREQSPILASMIASFRANQSAWMSRRVQVSRTGAIDTTKLAQYKLTDDLFLRRRSLPEAQNHGFVIHVDWSGSMEYNMATVLWQVLHLIWFAESIKVPISVYGFSNAGTSTEEFRTYCQALGYRSPAAGRLLELYRSNASAATKQDAQTFLFALALRFSGALYLWQEYANGGDIDCDGRLPRSLAPVVKALCPLVAGWDSDVRRQTFYHDYVNLGGTPLLHALFSSIDTVRKFRQTHHIEQCISVWLTDGEDTDSLNTQDNAIGAVDPNARPSYYSYADAHKGVIGRHSGGSRLIDPRSGRVFVIQEGRTLATLFDIHRALTGATVVCVDITSAPLASLRRVISRQDLSIVANSIGDSGLEASGYYRRGRRRRAYVKPKQIVQTRKRIVLPTGTGTFATTGLLLVTRKQYPQIGCDAYLVSHPDWWSKADKGITAVKAAAENVLSRSNSVLFDDDEDIAENHRAYGADFRTPVRLNDALLQQHATIAMRRFADLLVPYLAAGRDDASV